MPGMKLTLALAALLTTGLALPAGRFPPHRPFPDCYPQDCREVRAVNGTSNSTVASTTSGMPPLVIPTTAPMTPEEWNRILKLCVDPRDRHDNTHREGAELERYCLQHYSGFCCYAPKGGRLYNARSIDEGICGKFNLTDAECPPRSRENNKRSVPVEEQSPQGLDGVYAANSTSNSTASTNIPGMRPLATPTTAPIAPLEWAHIFNACLSGVHDDIYREGAELERYCLNRYAGFCCYKPKGGKGNSDRLLDENVCGKFALTESECPARFRENSKREEPVDEQNPQGSKEDHAANETSNSTVTTIPAFRPLPSPTTRDFSKHEWELIYNVCAMPHHGHTEDMTPQQIRDLREICLAQYADLCCYGDEDYEVRSATLLKENVCGKFDLQECPDWRNAQGPIEKSGLEHFPGDIPEKFPALKRDVADEAHLSERGEIWDMIWKIIEKRDEGTVKRDEAVVADESHLSERGEIWDMIWKIIEKREEGAVKRDVAGEPSHSENDELWAAIWKIIEKRGDEPQPPSPADEKAPLTDEERLWDREHKIWKEKLHPHGPPDHAFVYDLQPHPIIPDFENSGPGGIAPTSDDHITNEFPPGELGPVDFPTSEDDMPNIKQRYPPVRVPPKPCRPYAFPGQPIAPFPCHDDNLEDGFPRDAIHPIIKDKPIVEDKPCHPYNPLEWCPIGDSLMEKPCFGVNIPDDVPICLPHPTLDHPVDDHNPFVEDKPLITDRSHDEDDPDYNPCTDARISITDVIFVGGMTEKAIACNNWRLEHPEWSPGKQAHIETEADKTDEEREAEDRELDEYEKEWKLEHGVEVNEWEYEDREDGEWEA